MNGMRRYIPIGLLFVSLCTAADLPRSLSVRDVMFRLSDAVAVTAARELSGYRVTASAHSADTLDRTYTPSLLQGLSIAGIPVTDRSASPDLDLSFSVRDASVIHGESFSLSFFGPRLCARTIRLSVVLTAVSLQSGKNSWTKEFSETITDTVEVDRIELLSEFAPPLTAVLLPERSFFETYLEPAIVTAAAGVAVYLFFTIRS